METVGIETEKFSIEMMPNRILVKIAERVSKEGLFLPDTVKKKLGEGIVMRAGANNIHTDYPSLGGGERILFYKGGADKVEIGNQEYLIIQIPDVYLILYRGEVPEFKFDAEVRTD